MRTDYEGEQVSLFDRDIWCGRMCRARSAQTEERTSGRSSKKQSGSPARMPPTFHFLAGGGWPLADAWYGSGWSVAYRVFDAQFWGTPQRRRRIALVADFGGQSAPEILFVRESVCGNTEAGGNGGPEAAAGAGRGAGEAGTLCLNDQGGSVMSVSVDVAGTLRAQEHGHQPLVFENHGQDSRVKGPLEVSPTVSQKWGTGGNNTPLVMATGQENAEIGADVCPTLNCNHEQPIVAHTLRGTGKDPHRADAMTYPVQKGVVRRMTPLECERLQGFPDGWTDIGDWVDSKGRKRKTSDAARYRALGNSIALPPWKWVLKRLCACYERDATMASLFDGIGGFPLIWERLNGPGSCLWASEIEEFPIAVTMRRFGEEGFHEQMQNVRR